MNLLDLEKKSKEIKKKTLEMCMKGGFGHISSCFSCADILVALYYSGVMKYNPNEPKWKDRDRFILSKGHAVPILYTILADVGYFPEEELDTFCKPGSDFYIHPNDDIPGIEVISGSLGYGLGIGAGMAIANPQSKIFVLLGDAECQEGSIWEAVMFAGKRNIQNLIAIVDNNGMGATSHNQVESSHLGFAKFGWNQFRVDGHNINELCQYLKFNGLGFPSLIISETSKGGLSHGRLPNKEQLEKMVAELNE